jgi:dihydrofolate synthase/folylpolyglutamate synthase
MDGATSTHAAIQTQLDRLHRQSLPIGRLSLYPVQRLLALLGDPQHELPPVFHVAGTNGKGSTCAFLRAMLEADGKRVHLFTSPHLVRFNERFRIGGRLIDDDALAAYLEQVLDHNIDVRASFFEVCMAIACLAFRDSPADACLFEVGLGGRYDATNVLPAPAVCGIASLGLDHREFLLAPEPAVPRDAMCRIAFEKAGIAKPEVPLVTQSYPADMAQVIADVARWNAAIVHAQGAAWHVQSDTGDWHYRDTAGTLQLPLPALRGAHQLDNAGLAIAMLRHQGAVRVSDEGIAKGVAAAFWPARLQRLSDGPLTALLPGSSCWLDGGHNADAGAALAQHFAALPDRSLHLIIGMLKNKDPRSIVGPLAPKLASITAVPVPGHRHHSANDLRIADVPVRAAPDVPIALKSLRDIAPRQVLISGTLYLAGAVLAANEEVPD